MEGRWSHIRSRFSARLRIWATQVLREFLVKGLVLDDEPLKQGRRTLRCHKWA
ncbi:MAG: RhuM family protein [Terracidiphilus sp.]